MVDVFPVINNLHGFLALWKAKAENHFNTKYELRHENFRQGLESGAYQSTPKRLSKTMAWTCSWMSWRLSSAL